MRIALNRVCSGRPCGGRVGLRTVLRGFYFASSFSPVLSALCGGARPAGLSASGCSGYRDFQDSGAPPASALLRCFAVSPAGEYGQIFLYCSDDLFYISSDQR